MNIDGIKKILDIAVWAPSGDNSQPWRFKIENNRLHIFNIPDRDNPILNFRQSGSYVAHGGLIENILIASPHFGYNADVAIFPNSSDKNLVSTVSFEKTDKKDSPLYEYIKQRVTNRKQYKKDKNLTQEQKKGLLDGVDSIGGGKVIFAEDREKKRIIGNALSTMERVALETESLHRLFFGGILWSKKKNEKGKGGLYINSLEVPPPIKLAFKLLKHWKFTKIVNKIGFSKFASKGNAQTYSKSSALYVVAIDEDSPEGFIKAGRISQRVWLNGTKLGLSVQPVTGILFLARKILARDTDIFNNQHISLIKNAYEQIKSAFGIQNKTMAMAFRIGYANKPTARSYRISPDIQIED